MTSSFLAQVRQDAMLYRRMRSHRASSRAGSLMLTALRSRGLWMLETQRVIHYSTSGGGKLRRRIARMLRPLGMYLTAVITKSEFLEDCHISQDVYLSDLGHIVCGAQDIGAGSVIHDHCTLGGVQADGETGRPIIGRNVWVGPHCVIVGSLTIGEGATILPGTFLTFSVRPNALVAGNPARVIAETFDNTSLRASSLVSDLPSGRGK
jgi:serine acetyltransferase